MARGGIPVPLCEHTIWHSTLVCFFRGALNVISPKQRCGHSLRSDHPHFDAVFAGDDDAAIGALIALKDAGYRVPEEVSVAGFDDQKSSAFLNPPLTTVRARQPNWLEVWRAKISLRFLRDRLSIPQLCLPPISFFDNRVAARI